jgi:hypothetical protein
MSAKVKITHKNKKKLEKLGYVGNKGNYICVDEVVAKDFYMSVFVKKCIHCGETYETKNYYTRFCSRSCSAKYQWNDDFKNKMKDFYNTEEQKNKKSLAAKNSWDDKRKNKVSKKLKEIWTNDKKEERKQEMLERWKDPDFKEKMKNANIEAQNRPEMIESNRKRGIERWKDKDFAESQMKKMYKYKKYKLPSGKIVKLQGYEPQVLTDLLKTYNENDIIIGRRNISNIIGDIEYFFDGIKHTYFPDFYIKSENKIIEVKSIYTYELHKEKNKEKEKSCLIKGLKFEFIIHKS